MYELILAAGCVVIATGLVAQLLRLRTGVAATAAAVLHTIGGAAVCALMLAELAFGGGDGLELTGLPLDLGAAVSVLVAGLNLALGWSILQTRLGVLAGESGAVEKSLRAACTLVLLNAPLIPFEATATGVIVAAAVTCLGVATSRMGPTARVAPLQTTSSSRSLWA